MKIISGSMILVLSACVAIPTEIVGNEKVTQHLLSNTPENITELSADAATNSNVWTTIQVYIARAEGGETAWHIDAYLAHLVFKEVLLKYAYDIQLWRFHRRSADDSAGHRFSFIFYTSSDKVEMIKNTILSKNKLLQLQSEGIVSKVVIDNFNNNNQTYVQDTSDPSWSEYMKASWPFFIMGVSQSWLALLDNVIARLPEINLDQPLPETLAFYQIVNDKVTAIWRAEGGHAYLHHLNAIFGYEKVLIIERKEIRF